MQLAAILSVVLAVAAGGAIAAPARESSYTSSRVELSVRLPAGWHVVTRRLTRCTDPVELLTVVGRGALVMLQERLAGGRGFPPRPERFVLRGRARPMECCEPLRRPGWFLGFRDAGRGFYAYVYLGGPGTRAEALSVLDSLRVRS